MIFSIISCSQILFFHTGKDGAFESFHFEMMTVLAEHNLMDIASLVTVEEVFVPIALSKSVLGSIARSH